MTCYNKTHRGIVYVRATGPLESLGRLAPFGLSCMEKFHLFGVTISSFGVLVLIKISFSVTEHLDIYESMSKLFFPSCRVF